MQNLFVLASLVSELAGGQNSRPSLPRNNIRASLEKNYISGILVERAINFVNFVEFYRT